MTSIAAATATPTEIARTPTATPDIAGTVVAANKPKTLASYPSPDRKWQAVFTTYGRCTQGGGADMNAYEQLKLIQVDNQSEKVVDDQLQYCGGLGAYGLGGLFWSPNSRYFYYTNAREGMPEGCGPWERPLVRLDTANWKIERLGGGPLSPNKTKIATWQGQELVVWDVTQGEIARTMVAVPDAITGEIAWSPNGQSIVYLQTALDCYPWGKSYLVRLDLPKLKSSLLLESEKPSFWGVTWDAPNRLRLLDENGEKWQYNLVTQELKK